MFKKKKEEKQNAFLSQYIINITCVTCFEAFKPCQNNGQRKELLLKIKFCNGQAQMGLQLHVVHRLV